jgi:hypothetical protein
MARVEGEWSGIVLKSRTKAAVGRSTSEGRQGWIFFFFFLERIWLSSQAGFELAILLPQPAEIWDYRGEPPCLAGEWISY